MCERTNLKSRLVIIAFLLAVQYSVGPQAWAGSVVGWGSMAVDSNDFAGIQTANSEPNVTQEWVARYNGLGNGSDIAEAIALDSNGNIYVTGTSFGAGTGDDYVTIKYSPDSNQPIWIARYNGTANSTDKAFAIAVDGADNIYVTGFSTGFDTFDDYTTIKYSAESNEPVWVARYDGPGSYADVAYAIAVDSHDNIYVTGYSCNVTCTHHDYATVKYSPESNEPVWVARYDGSSTDVAEAIAVDSKGNIYVTGYTWGYTSSDCTTVKYSPDSNQPVWVARYNGPGNYNDVGMAIAVDGTDSIYVAGFITDSGTSYYDYATIKYSPESNQPVWVARYNRPTNVNNQAYAIAVDSNDNIYVTGKSSGFGTSYDYATIKYSPESNERVWVARYDGPSSGPDQATAIAVDAYDNICVAGKSTGSDTGYDYATVKYSPDSNQPVWIARYNGPGNGLDSAQAVAVDSNGNIYVTGRSFGAGTGDDYATIKYSLPCLLPLEVEINIRPQILNLRSKGKSIICRISLPEDYNVGDIEPNSILLEDEIPAERVRLGDGFAVARFSRGAVQEMLGEVETPCEVELVVSGELSDGSIFKGTDAIRVIDVGGGKNNEPPGKALKQVNRNRKRIKGP